MVRGGVWLRSENGHGLPGEKAVRNMASNEQP